MRKVVFVCLHGSAKSLIASQLFTRGAAEAGLLAEGVCFGLEPDREVPPNVIAGLRRVGFDVSRHVPEPLPNHAPTDALAIVSFGYDLERLADPQVPVMQWRDVPAVSDDFDVAYNEIARRVAGLVSELAARSAGMVGS